MSCCPTDRDEPDWEAVNRALEPVLRRAEALLRAAGGCACGGHPGGGCACAGPPEGRFSVVAQNGSRLTFCGRDSYERWRKAIAGSPELARRWRGARFAAAREGEACRV